MPSQNKRKFKETEIGMIPEDWGIVDLKALCVNENGIQTGPFGSQLHQRDYVVEGTPIITVEHLGENTILHSNIPRVSSSDTKRLHRYSLQEGDIVFSRVGSVDRRAIVKKTEDGWLFSGRCLRVRINKGKMNPSFVSYYFGLESFRERVRSHAVGATMPSLNTKLLAEMKMVVPHLGEQRFIAESLSSLDDKIDLNQQMNKTLEKIGQAIFKYWFIDFEFPNERGKPYRSSGGEMVDSELGEIPKGWEVGKLKDYVHVTKGVSYKSVELKASKKALVTLRSINRGGGLNQDGFKEYIGEYKKEQEIIDGDVVVAHTDITQKAEVLGKPAIVRLIKKYEVLIASLDLSIVRPNDDLMNKPFLYYLFTSDDFQNHTFAYANGTTVLHLSSKAVPEYLFVMPNRKLMIIFGDIIENIFDIKKKNEAEIEVLSQIRDSLLPKLMSGKIRVNIEATG
jgi:type I restriction enzyme S subunit